MTYSGDKTRERKNEKARDCIGHEELRTQQCSDETTDGANGNGPIPRLERLGKWGGDCSTEQGEAIGTLDWKMVQRRWRYAVANLAVAMASSASPLRMRERARERK